MRADCQRRRKHSPFTETRAHALRCSERGLDETELSPLASSLGQWLVMRVDERIESQRAGLQRVEIRYRFRVADGSGRILV